MVLCIVAGTRWVEPATPLRASHSDAKRERETALAAVQRSGRADVEHEVAVVDGTVVITVDPRIRGGGLGDGSAHLTDAVAEDGMLLPDLQMSSDQIGFDAG